MDYRKIIDMYLGMVDKKMHYDDMEKAKKALQEAINAYCKKKTIVEEHYWDE